ncbi:RsmE family RNA methyltransferase, partial [Enterococcus faecalis]|uniref:RsmE family RNA methyltransferase n=1 Tax=Enterococcus faecalis TaxID=1351 RepID=UPI0039860F99
GLRDVLSCGVGETVSLLIGPEGGFAPEEAAFAVQSGLTSVSLGTRILRCETAPIAALAAVLYAGGNM